jgi:hypothetical protein
MPTPYPYDPVQTAIAIAYRNPSYIADLVLPRRPVGAEKFKYHSIPVAQSFRLPDTRAGRRGRLNEVDLTVDAHDSSTIDYGLAGSVPQSDQDQAYLIPGYDPVGNLTMQIAEFLALDREKRAADLCLDAAQYPTANKVQLAGNDQWDVAHADSNPIQDVLAGVDAMLVPPTHLVLGHDVWKALRVHPVVVQACHANEGSVGIVSRRQVGELFELELLIGPSRLNTAKFGQAASLSRVWAGSALLCHIAPSASVDGSMITFGLTAEYGTRVAGTEAIAPGRMGIRGGVRVYAGESLRELIVAPEAAYLIEDAV